MLGEEEEALLDKLDNISDNDPNYYNSSVIEKPDSLKKQRAKKKAKARTLLKSPAAQAREAEFQHMMGIEVRDQSEHILANPDGVNPNLADHFSSI